MLFQISLKFWKVEEPSEDYVRPLDLDTSLKGVVDPLDDDYVKENDRATCMVRQGMLSQQLAEF